MKLGFNNSIEGALKSEFTDKAIETGAVKKLGAAFGNYSMIEVSGTLKDPKYKIKADVQSIAESIAEHFGGE